MAAQLPPFIFNSFYLLLKTFEKGLNHVVFNASHWYIFIKIHTHMKEDFKVLQCEKNGVIRFCSNSSDT